MPGILDKVTAFITRRSNEGYDLLLFEHSSAGIQIPAGTVEAGETPEAAVLREAAEETGLTIFSAQNYLGSVDDVLPVGQCVICESTKVYARPDAASFDWAHLRRGIRVRRERQADRWSQVTYEEWDRMSNPSYVTYRITGWVPDHTITNVQRRHLFLLEYVEPTAERWTVDTDNHRFTLFWAPLTALPSIIHSQAPWIEMLHATGRFEPRK